MSISQQPWVARTPNVFKTFWETLKSGNFNSLTKRGFFLLSVIIKFPARSVFVSTVSLQFFFFYDAAFPKNCKLHRATKNDLITAFTAYGLRYCFQLIPSHPPSLSFGYHVYPSPPSTPPLNQLGVFTQRRAILVRMMWFVRTGAAHEVETLAMDDPQWLAKEPHCSTFSNVLVLICSWFCFHFQ